jgi:glycolate oxidase
VLKNATGYNLTQLIVGSEGTLAVITKIIFKLLPYPKRNVLMLAPFYSAEKACEAVSAVFRAGVIPSAMEFMERDAIDFAHRHLFPSERAVVPGFPPTGMSATLLIEIDGNDIDLIMKEVETVSQVLSQHECGDVLFADTEEQKANLWRLRRGVAEAVKSHSVYKEEDTVVPRAELPKLLRGVKEIGARYGFRSICYGHAGDGNLHVNIIRENMSDEKWNYDIPEKAIPEIFQLCVSLGGTLSGEHGIGWVQRRYMGIAFHEKALEIQRKIKSIFDPAGILNPGKIFS